MFTRINDVPETPKKEQQAFPNDLKLKVMEQPAETKSNTNETESKPKPKLSKSVIFLIVCVVVAAVIAVVVFFVVRSFKEESSNIRKQLEIANETERMLKTKLVENNKEIKSLNDVIKQQDYQLKFLGEEQFKHQFKELEPTNENDVPKYEIDEVYDEMEPGAHKRKSDPRIEVKKQVRNLVNQKRETVEDQQIANKVIMDRVQDEDDENIQQQIRNVVANNEEEDNEYDEVMSIIQQ